MKLIFKTQKNLDKKATQSYIIKLQYQNSIVKPEIIADELSNLLSQISRKDLLNYIIDLEKEKVTYMNLKTNMIIDFKRANNEMVGLKQELEQVKNSYRELLSKLGGKEIQIRGYRLALNNANELLFEMINQIEHTIK